MTELECEAPSHLFGQLGEWQHCLGSLSSMEALAVSLDFLHERVLVGPWVFCSDFQRTAPCYVWAKQSPDSQRCTVSSDRRPGREDIEKTEGRQQQGELGKEGESGLTLKTHLAPMIFFTL